MINKKCTNLNCRRQQPDILLGFWKDITTQEFCIKSNGRVVKRFMGKVFVPIDIQSPDTLSIADIKNVFRQGTHIPKTDLSVSSQGESARK